MRPRRPEPLTYHHALLVEQAARSRVLLFPSADGARLIAGAIAASFDLPAPHGTGPESAVASHEARISLWRSGLAAEPLLAVVGENEDGPLLLLAPSPVAALAARSLVAGPAWQPEVVAVEDGLAADIDAPPPFPPLELADQVRPGPVSLSHIRCPHCGERRLHRNPVYDDRSQIDGSQICHPCGDAEAIALDREHRRALRAGSN